MSLSRGFFYSRNTFMSLSRGFFLRLKGHCGKKVSLWNYTHQIDHYMLEKMGCYRINYLMQTHFYSHRLFFWNFRFNFSLNNSRSNLLAIPFYVLISVFKFKWSSKTDIASQLRLLQRYFLRQSTRVNKDLQ